MHRTGDHPATIIRVVIGNPTAPALHVLVHGIRDIGTAVGIYILLSRVKYSEKTISYNINRQTIRNEIFRVYAISLETRCEHGTLQVFVGEHSPLWKECFKTHHRNDENTP